MNPVLVDYLHIAFEAWAALFCVIAAVCVWASRQFHPEASMSLLGMLSVDAVLNVSEIIYHFYRGEDAAYAGLIARCAVFSIYLWGFVLAVLTAIHIGQVVVIRGGMAEPILTGLTVAFSCAGLCIVLCMQSEGYSLIILFASFSIVPILLQIIRNRSALRPREVPAYIMFCMLPMGGLILQLFTPGVYVFNLTNSLSLILLILIHQLGYTEDTIEHQKQLVDEQLKLYTSQIQPHFIYNCLTTIRSYLPEDSEARDALNHFAGFLRGSIDLLMSTECVPVSREFKTVDNYLYMEKSRFGDDIRIKKEIEDIDFKLPPFTVQFLVENAIRHGIRENPGGRGTLILKSYKTDEGHFIEIIDDGPGFDPEKLSEPEGAPGEDGKVHIGLVNVKKRLEIMCSGTVYVESKPGVGTHIKVFIPDITP